MRVRLATEADLPRVAAIWLEAHVEDDDRPLFTSEVPWLFVHELEHGELRVPERDGDALAYGALLERGGRGLRTVMWHAGSIAVSQPVR